MVTHQSRDYVLQALASGRASAEAAGVDYEVIVVDNISTDGTADLVRAACPWVRLIQNTDNVGFGRANNQAFEAATGRVLVLINPDATLDLGAMGEMLRFLRSHPDAAAVAPSLRTPGSSESAGMLPGLRSLAGHFLLLNHLLPGDRGGAWRGMLVRRTRGTRPRPVDWVSAAAVAYDAKAIRAIGGFDPRIFMYAEDVDLCARLGETGRSSWLLPSATGSHAIAGSQGRHSTLWVGALHAYYKVRAGRVRLAVFDLLIAVGLGARGVVAGRADSAEARIHRENMRAGARRAARLFYDSLTGKG